jgi:hypothetical protein
MKGTLLLWPKGFRPYVASNCIGVIQTSKVALPPFDPSSLQVWSKSGSKEGHFILDAETVFRPYLASHCSRVTQTSQVALLSHAP